MSIYATRWILKFPRDGYAHTGCEWVSVYGQAVPAHIGTPTPGEGYERGDPYASFLPPAIPVPIDYDGKLLRAFVVVTDEAKKVGQEYISPLLVLSGDEYTSIAFDELYSRICDALLDGRPRPIGEFIRSDGTTSVVYDDGTTRNIPHHKG